MANVNAANLPIPGSKLAPKTFRGKHSQVKPFLQHYERLCIKHNVAEAERCTNILQYCSRQVKECIKGLDAYGLEDWDQLQEEIKDVYDAERDEKRYKKEDLDYYVSKSSKREITELSHWKKYVRGFIGIAMYLRSKEFISELDMHKEFWKGIHTTFQKDLSTELKIVHGPHDVTRPWNIELVKVEAAKLLHRQRFDAPKDQEDTEYDNDSDSDSDTDSDSTYSNSSSEDNGWRKSKKNKNSNSKTKVRTKLKHKSKLKKHHVSFNSSDSESDSEKLNRKPVSTRTARRTVRELDKQEDLAAKHDEVETIINRLSNMSLNDKSYGVLYYRALKLDPDVIHVIRAPVSRTEYIPSSSNLNQRSPSLPNALRNANLQCYGCGESGHGISSCPAIDKLLQKGVITKDSRGKLIMKDGSRITRQRDEPFTQAIERLNKAQSHLIVFQDTCSDSDSDDSDAVYAFEVQRRARAAKQNAKTSKESIVGVYPPRISAKEKTKYKSINEQSTNPTPVDTHKSAYDPSKDDSIMEDTSQPSKISLPERKKFTPRQSTISSQVNPQDVVYKILSTPITLAVGEVMGVSKELSSMFQDVLKFKSTKPETHIVSFVENSVRGNLIKLDIVCNGKIINAIVDTGSELNIMRKDIWKDLRIPMDIAKQCTINDANGGEGILHGLVQNVPLSCGSVRTYANCYVGENLPFELLLGRPWQRDNRINIEERSDGTYLIFRSAENEDSQFEMLAAPSNLSFNKANRIPSFMTQVVEHEQTQDFEHTSLPRPSTKQRVSEYFPNVVCQELMCQEGNDFPSNVIDLWHSDLPTVTPHTPLIRENSNAQVYCSQDDCSSTLRKLPSTLSENSRMMSLHRSRSETDLQKIQQDKLILEENWPGTMDSYKIWPDKLNSHPNSPQITSDKLSSYQNVPQMNENTIPDNSFLSDQSAHSRHYSAEFPTNTAHNSEIILGHSHSLISAPLLFSENSHLPQENILDSRQKLSINTGTATTGQTPIQHTHTFSSHTHTSSSTMSSLEVTTPTTTAQAYPPAFIVEDAAVLQLFSAAPIHTRAPASLFIKGLMVHGPDGSLFLGNAYLHMYPTFYSDGQHSFTFSELIEIGMSDLSSLSSHESDTCLFDIVKAGSDGQADGSPSPPSSNIPSTPSTPTGGALIPLPPVEYLLLNSGMSQSYSVANFADLEHDADVHPSLEDILQAPSATPNSAPFLEFRESEGMFFSDNDDAITYTTAATVYDSSSSPSDRYSPSTLSYSDSEESHAVQSSSTPSNIPVYHSHEGAGSGDGYEVRDHSSCSDDDFDEDYPGQLQEVIISRAQVEFEIYEIAKIAGQWNIDEWLEGEQQVTIDGTPVLQTRYNIILDNYSYPFNPCNPLISVHEMESLFLTYYFFKGLKHEDLCDDIIGLAERRYPYPERVSEWVEEGIVGEMVL